MIFFSILFIALNVWNMFFSVYMYFQLIKALIGEFSFVMKEENEYIYIKKNYAVFQLN